jgi:hypothetical protein
MLACAQGEIGSEPDAFDAGDHDGDGGDRDADLDTGDDGSPGDDGGPGDDGPVDDGAVNRSECENWQALHPEWIFCDDFERDEPMVGSQRYFEYDDNAGEFVPSEGVGREGSRGMRVRWQTGEVGAGGLKLAFGRNPNGYMNKDIRPQEDFREIHYRMYLRMEAGWQGSPAKLSRATVFTSADAWDQAMIAHLWSDANEHLLVDPVRCVDTNNQVKYHGYNDFYNMDWLGNLSGTTPLFAGDHSDRWFCIEAHVRLNDAGQANGVQEFFIDGNLEARRENLDFVRAYNDYAINAIFFENHWNAGSPREQERYFDNIVVSTEPIGCL